MFEELRSGFEKRICTEDFPLYYSDDEFYRRYCSRLADMDGETDKDNADVMSRILKTTLMTKSILCFCAWNLTKPSSNRIQAAPSSTMRISWQIECSEQAFLTKRNGNQAKNIGTVSCKRLKYAILGKRATCMLGFVLCSRKNIEKNSSKAIRLVRGFSKLTVERQKHFRFPRGLRLMARYYYGP